MNYKKHYLTMSIYLILFLSFSVIAKGHSILNGMEAVLTLGTQYDDNTNEYSEMYINRFKNAEDSGRFHIPSIDDGTANAKLRLKAKFKLLGNLQTSIDASALYKMFLNNDINNNGKFSISLGQQIARKTYIHATYALVPHFYVCHFLDKDWSSILGKVPESYMPFEYTKDVYSLQLLRYVKKGSSISADFDYSRYFYNEHYSEYDSKKYSFSLHGNIASLNDLLISCNYSYDFNDAKGYDGDISGETRETSDDADDSFREHGGYLGLEWYLPSIVGKNQTLRVSGSLHYRNYLTTKSIEIDRTHSGRLEYVMDASASYTISILKPLALQIEYSRIQRWAGSSHAINNEYIKKAKSYSKNVAEFCLQYTLCK